MPILPTMTLVQKPRMARQGQNADTLDPETLTKAHPPCQQ